MVWHRKALIYFIIIIMFPVAAVLELACRVPYVGYYDEIITVYCITILVLNLKRINGTREMVIINCMLILIIIIGTISYAFNGNGASVCDIITDIVIFLKRWVIFETVYLQEDYIKTEIIERMRPLCKSIIVFTFICAILSQFIPSLGTEEHISIAGFTLTAYGFIWKNGVQTIWLISGAVLLIIFKKVNSTKNPKLYIYMWVITICLTLKTTGFCLVLAYIALELLMKKGTKIKWYHIFILGITILVCGYSAIQIYFINDLNSPRLVLILYGLKTALRYFPLGAGFTMYGSAVANKIYSSLYYEYGFTQSYALSNAEGGGGCLNDNYLGMLMGQFGLLGLIATVVMFCMFYKFLNKMDYGEKTTKICILAVYISILTTLVASATSNSMLGVWTMAIFALVSMKSGVNTENNLNNRIVEE